MTKWGELRNRIKARPLPVCAGNGIIVHASNTKTNSQRNLVTDASGVTIIEFAIVAPVFFLLLFGAFDVTYNVYAKSVLESAMQEAGRNSALETAPTRISDIDNSVQEQVQGLVPHGEFTFTRRNYAQFSDVGGLEEADTEDPDCFYDKNGNGVRDDPGKDGLGDGDDVVLYTATVEYNHLFPLWRFIGGTEKAKLSATTTLRNQPYSDQKKRETVLVCPSAP